MNRQVRFSVRILVMKSAALVLTLAFAGLQTVSFADCCCMDECARKSRQETSCGNCEAPQSSTQHTEDCCDSKDHATPPAEQGSTNCLHVQPSPDVHSHAHDVIVIPESAIVAVLELAAGTPARPSAPTEDHSPPESLGRPLFILHSALLI